MDQFRRSVYTFIVDTVILKTKIHIPPSPGNLVNRFRLINTLNNGLAGRLTLVSAAAGYGKTTLVRDWLDSCGRSSAWLSLDETHSEPLNFLIYLIAALGQAAEHVGRLAASLLDSPQQPDVKMVLINLINEVAEFAEPIMLILDDYHSVDNHEIDSLLQFFVENMPENLHLVLVSREDPDLSLAKLRAGGLLTEIRAGDLRFTQKEAEVFLHKIQNCSLSPEDAAALEMKTEGWITGLKLAALSLAGQENPTEFISRFTGSHRFILDYLLEEVLDEQSEDVRMFLLSTSILERFCPSLCDALLTEKSSSSRDILNYLEKANIFIVSLDDQGEWYRYHHLFGDLLRKYLVNPASVRSTGSLLELKALHRRAAQWFEAHGMDQDAVSHAFSAEDISLAAGLLERLYPEMDQKFQSRQWRVLAEKLPEQEMSRRPVLCVHYAWALLDTGTVDGVGRWLDTAESLLRFGEDGKPEVVSQNVCVTFSDFLDEIAVKIASARAYCAQLQMDIPAVKKYAERVLEISAIDDHLNRGVGASLLGMLHWNNGELARAFDYISQTMDAFEKNDKILFHLTGCYALGEILRLQGRLNDAETLLSGTIEKTFRQGGSMDWITGNHFCILSQVYLEQGKPGKAAEALDASFEYSRFARLEDWPYRYHISRAFWEEALGNDEKALEFLQKAEAVYFVNPMPDYYTVDSLKCRLLIKNERLPEARNWLSGNDFSVDDDVNFLNEFDHLSLVRLILAENRVQKNKLALGVLESFLSRLLDAAEKGNRIGSVVEILIHSALTALLKNETGSALDFLRRALDTGKNQHFRLVYIREGEPVRKLLQQLEYDDEAGEDARAILADFDAFSGEPAKTILKNNGNDSLTEPLSRRELEILELIAQGLSNSDISEKLFVALSTIKGHNQKIFAKLGVQRRTEAIARARELRLI